MINQKVFRLIIDKDFEDDWEEFLKYMKMDMRLDVYVKNKKTGAMKLDKRGNISHAIRAILRGYVKGRVNYFKEEARKKMEAQKQTNNDQSSNIPSSVNQ